MISTMNNPYNSGFENSQFIRSNKSFEEQRKGRLAESIDEYLNEGRAKDLIDYHGKRKDHAVEALSAVLGHRPIPELGEELPMPQDNRL
jgi:hypothetical protein